MYMYALIMRICKTRVRRIQGPAQPKHYRIVFLQQQSSTDLHAVACNLGKLNAGAKFIIQRASHLSADTADYLAIHVVIYWSAVLFHILLYDL